MKKYITTKNIVLGLGVIAGLSTLATMTITRYNIGMILSTGIAVGISSWIISIGKFRKGVELEMTPWKLPEQNPEHFTFIPEPSNPPNMLSRHFANITQMNTDETVAELTAPPAPAIIYNLTPKGTDCANQPDLNQVDPPPPKPIKLARTMGTSLFPEI